MGVSLKSLRCAPKGGGICVLACGALQAHANQPACTVALGGLLALQISALAPPRPAGGIARSSRRFHDHVWGLRRPPPVPYAIHRPTGATTTPATHVGGELRCTLGNRVSQTLRDQGSGARVASWTIQPAIHGGQHATRATTTSPTHFGGGTAELSRKRTAVRVHVELPQNTSPQIATLLSFPPLTSPQIITAYHERTMVLCGHDNSRAAASCEQVQDWEPRSSRSSTRSSRETANAERSSA